MNSVVVTGGAGYIGSHMVQALSRAGYRTVVIDNLSTGHAVAVQHGDFIQEDIADRGAVRAILRRHRPAAICHFAASCLVGESMQNPLLYYKNNVMGTLNVLEAALEAGVPRFVFSSSAAVYGDPHQSPITEEHPTLPVNPYGQSKLMGERILADAGQSFGMRFVAFRYFNAGGADPGSRLGEDHRPETHLVPLAIRAAIEQDHPLAVYGNDYPTPDGSCIRDFVHVLDLVDAHLLGLEYLDGDGENLVLNLGTEDGTSVLETVAAVERVTGLSVPHTIEGRRTGDPARLVASGAKAREILGWTPKYDLDDIIRSTYDFYRRFPEGYPAATPPPEELGVPQPHRSEVE